jgi:hypothetical protein
MPRRFSGSAAVLAHLDHVPGVAALRLAVQRNQGPCPRDVSVEFPSQQKPCPAPATEAYLHLHVRPTGPQAVPDGCSDDGTYPVPA